VENNNRHNGLLPSPTCYGLAIRETGVMDFGCFHRSSRNRVTRNSTRVDDSEVWCQCSTTTYWLN